MIKKLDSLPILLFLGGYLTFTYIGVVLLLWAPPVFKHLYTLFSGVKPPELLTHQLQGLISLLHWPILTFTCGYLLAIWVLRRYLGNTKSTRPEPSLALLIAGLVISITFAVISLERGNAFQNIQSWMSFEVWIASRWQLFSTLTFPEFVNLYLFMPVMSGLVANRVWTKHRRWLYVVVVLIPGFLLTLLLFQKKQPVVYLLVVCVPFLLSLRLSARRWSLRFATASIGVFFLLVFLPTLGFQFEKQDVATVVRGDLNWTDIVERTISGYKHTYQATLADENRTVESKDMEQKGVFPKGFEEWVAELGMGLRSNVFANDLSVDEAVLIYLTLPGVVQKGLFFGNTIVYRNAGPVIYYIITYPDHHEFYGLNVPFDGVTPDDNREVWKMMWPETPGGSVMVPLHISFYAQIGVVGATVLALLSGIIVGLVWYLSERRGFGTTIGVMYGTLVLLLALFLSIDAARFSVFSSYGVLWGFLLVGFIDFLELRIRTGQISGRKTAASH